MTTTYYECGIPARLIPVQFIGWAHDGSAVVRLKRAGGGYPSGQVLHIPGRSVVEKAGVRGGFQRVRTAPLPPVDPANRLPARV